MDQFREEVFEQIFRSGSIKSVGLQVGVNGRAVVVYVMQNGTTGMIYTKRGEIKNYRIETALRFVRSVGLVSVIVEMKNWSFNDAQQSF